MCGIVGIFHFDGQAAVDTLILRKMTRILAHRGPDDEGFFVDGAVGFGVRRLSIVDRALGHQPLAGEDGKTWIAYNGEIYNHPELRRALQARGHCFRTNCDTETVVHAYDEYGEEMVEQLRGMFAFALWDGKRKRLLLYRDRLGIKPLYYILLKNTLVFASEIKAVLQYGIPFALDDQVLECYLRLGYVPGERTLFRQVRKLLPGHYLVADTNQQTISLRKYWNLRFQAAGFRDEAYYQQELDRLLQETVAQHRLGEVPQGIFLSGGVDSSAMVAVTAPQASEPTLTFSVGYKDAGETSEFPYARRVANLYHTRHFEYELAMKGFAEALPKLIWHMDEPVADPAAIPLFFIARQAREEITVVHSGEGADEILAGYTIYKRMLWINKLRRLAGRFGTSLLAHSLQLPVIPYRLRRFSEWIEKPLEERYQGVRRLLPAQLLRRLGRNGFPTQTDAHYRRELFRCLYEKSKRYSDLNKMLSIDLQTWLPDDLLVKADKMTMAASVELRVPFLDHRIVEFAAALPCHLKINKGQSKYLLKEIMRKRLPLEILHAPKRGFPVPFGKWLRVGLFPVAQSWVLDSPLLRELFKRQELEKLLQLHRRGKVDLSEEIYGLVCLAVWFDVFAHQA